MWFSFCRNSFLLEVAGKAKRTEGNAEHDTAEAKGYLEGVQEKVIHFSRTRSRCFHRWSRRELSWRCRTMTPYLCMLPCRWSAP